MTSFITKCIILAILSIGIKDGIVILAQQQVPCLFVFGDAHFDNGNNDNLNTTFKANYLPYGIDYIYGSTGRFTNEANIPDFLAQRLGFSSSVPPFATANGTHAILQGLNYASGGAGILDETSYELGDRFSLNRLLNYHQGTVNQIANILGNPTATNNLLNQCLYTISIGSEDYGTNYFHRPPVTLESTLYTPETYAQKLIAIYTQQLTRLYSLGARKVAVFGILPIGCDPSSLTHYAVNASGCVDFLNDAVQLFNTKLISAINNLNNNLCGARFTYINFYAMLYTNPLSSIGVKVRNAACCESTTGHCAPNGSVCSNRDEYAYFDNYHPTGVVYNYVASRAYNAQSPSDAIPTDIATLLRR